RRRVAERGDGYVNRSSSLNEGRELGGDDDGRRIARARVLSANVHAHAIEDRLDRLVGERRVAQTIAGSVEAYHQAIAHQLVRTHALNGDDVLDSGGGAK